MKSLSDLVCFESMDLRQRRRRKEWDLLKAFIFNASPSRSVFPIFIPLNPKPFFALICLICETPLLSLHFILILFVYPSHSIHD